MTVTTARVAVIGGGLVGLTTALALDTQGIDTMLLERHHTTSPQPKARRLTFRTVEIFAALGLYDAVREAGAGLAGWERMLSGPTLAESEQLPVVPPETLERLETCSPLDSALCSQDLLEPLLRRIAVERGIDVAFETEVCDLRQDTNGVELTVVDRTMDRQRRIEASYAVAADGAKSPTRWRLGIGRHGWGSLGSSVSVYFRADLGELITGREFNLFFATRGGGGLASVDGRWRWVYLGEPADLDSDGWADRVRECIGADLPVEVLSIMRWEPEMRVADRFADGRVFLAGDAAHVMPPFAALGANTGILDADNLAWKLGFVLRGQAAPDLLSTYDAERRPAGWFNACQSSLRVGQRPGEEIAPGLADPLLLVLGAPYAEGALVPDGEPDDPIDRLELRARPGTRVPHRWTTGVEGWVSTLDLIRSDRLTLLAGASADRWRPIAPPGVAVEVVAELPGEEAWLVRPDRIVGWRSIRWPGADAAREQMVTALDAVLTPEVNPGSVEEVGDGPIEPTTGRRRSRR